MAQVNKQPGLPDFYTPPPEPQEARRAALIACLHAETVEEASEFIDMLGLRDYVTN